MHISGEHMHACLAEEVLVGRHGIVAPLDHGFNDHRLERTVQPGLVGEIGRPKLLVALAVGTVAGDAVVRRLKQRRPALRGRRTVWFELRGWPRTQHGDNPEHDAGEE